MPPAPAQNLSSHRRWNPLYHFVAAPIFVANFVHKMALAWGRWDSADIWEVVLAFGLVVALLVARTMALRVQDRVIRLEMRLRLREVLPATSVTQIGELTPRQLVGLRFAGDGELPDLVQRCLSGELASQRAVKRAIRDWQPDWLRA